MAEARPPVRWSRMALALLLLLGAMEGVCRVGIQRWLGRPFGTFDAYAFSGYGVYRQNPHYTHPEFVHNSVGFRNEEEFAIEKPPGRFRVMAIGASVLYSGSASTHQGISPRVRTSETITAYLEPHLRQMPELAGYEVEVINASVNRQDIRQTITYYIAELSRYDPDVVIVFGTHNDTAYLDYHDAARTLFYDHERPTAEEARLELLANASSFRAVAEKVLRAAVDRSALAAGAYRGLDRALLFINLQRKSGRLEARYGDMETAPAEEVEENLRIYLAALDALVTYIRVRGAEPVVFWEYMLLQLEGVKPLSPYERDLFEWLEQSGAGFSADELRWKLAIRDRVEAHLASRDVPLIDIIDELRAYPGTVFNDYLHYNAEGNRVVAEWIAKQIRPVVAKAVAAREGPR